MQPQPENKCTINIHWCPFYFLLSKSTPSFIVALLIAWSLKHTNTHAHTKYSNEMCYGVKYSTETDARFYVVVKIFRSFAMWLRTRIHVKPTATSDFSLKIKRNESEKTIDVDHLIRMRMYTLHIFQNDVCNLCVSVCMCDFQLSLQKNQQQQMSESEKNEWKTVNSGLIWKKATTSIWQITRGRRCHTLLSDK